MESEPTTLTLERATTVGDYLGMILERAVEGPVPAWVIRSVPMPDASLIYREDPPTVDRKEPSFGWSSFDDPPPDSQPTEPALVN